MIFFCVFIICLSTVTTDTIGERLDEDLAYVKSVATAMHGPCAPCGYIKKRGKLCCDCRRLEPKRDCLEYHKSGAKRSGIYMIKNNGFSFREVYCDQTTQGGGWTVFQRRRDGSTNFVRKWNDYKNGFGKVYNEFWLGNSALHDLTQSSKNPKGVQLLINMRMKSSTKWVFALYNQFRIGNEASKYTLHVSGYTGNATDRMSFHNKMKFSTIDADNDVWGSSCARKYKGGWWYKSCHHCNLNGPYKFSGTVNDIQWLNTKTGQPLFVEMKLRRKL